MAADETWNPKFPEVGQRVHQTYRRDDRTIQVYAIYFPVQQQGQELISRLNRIYDDTYWRPITERSRSVTLPNGDLFVVNETEMTSRRTERVVWNWYEIAGRRTTNPFMGKILETWARIILDGKGSMLVMVAAPYDMDPADARTTLQMFLDDVPAFTRPGAFIPRTP